VKAKTATLSDANFEKMMFMKENNHIETVETRGAGGQAIITGLVMLIPSPPPQPFYRPFSGQPG